MCQTPLAEVHDVCALVDPDDAVRRARGQLEAHALGAEFDIGDGGPGIVW